MKFTLILCKCQKYNNERNILYDTVRPHIVNFDNLNDHEILILCYLQKHHQKVFATPGVLGRSTLLNDLQVYTMFFVLMFEATYKPLWAGIMFVTCHYNKRFTCLLTIFQWKYVYLKLIFVIWTSLCNF